MRRIALTVLLVSAIAGGLADAPTARADVAAGATPPLDDAAPGVCCPPPMPHYRPRTTLVPEMLRSVDAL